MIDIHCHILPGIDDGSSGTKESLNMATVAVQSGVTDIITTPHVNIPGYYDNTDPQELREYVRFLQEKIDEWEIPLQLHPGMEVYTTDEIPSLWKKKRLLTLADSSYLLMEFSFDTTWDYVQKMMLEVDRLNLRPLIAHPERYYFVQDNPEVLYELAEAGVPIQVNKGSLFGSFGKSAQAVAHWCLQTGCLSMIASDAHRSDRRNPKLDRVWEYIADYTAPEIADFLLEENPCRVLKDEEILPVFDVF